MSITSYPAGLRSGLLLKEIPTFDLVAGNVYWVDSGIGGAGNPGTFNKPLATLSQAVSKCTANNGDRIYLAPGHSEAIAAATTISKAGITVIGTGHAGDMSQIRFTADVDLNLTGASTRFINVRFTAAFADVAAAIDIDANNIEFHHCRFDEEATDENYVTVINVGDGFDNFVMSDCDYIGNDASNDTLVVFAGTHENCKIVGNRMAHLTAQTAAAAFITSATQMINMTLEGNRMHTETAAITANGFVVLANATNNGWAVNNMLSSVDSDLTAAQALASFDVTGLFCKDNYFSSGVADTYAVESFLTVEDLT